MTNNRSKLEAIIQNLRYLESQAEKSGLAEVAIFIGAARLAGIDIVNGSKAPEDKSTISTSK